MEFEYKTKGVCSSKILFDMEEDHTLRNIHFVGGCQGNLAGISKLVSGMKAEDVIERLRGTTCGAKHTSCPDQLAVALEEALQKV
jgi:uncharacterized protein (TIGR03905 family)